MARRTRSRRKHPERRAKPLPLAEIEADLATWSRDELLAFVSAAIQRDQELREAVEARVRAQQGDADLLGRLKDRIDVVLNVDTVEWKEVRAFVAKLNCLVADLADLGSAQPDAALDGALHFVQGIYQVQDRVFDEVELQWTCERLGQAIVKLAQQANANPVEIGSVLLDTYIADAHGRFHAFAELVADLPTTQADCEKLAALAEQHAAKVTGSYMKDPLVALAEKFHANGGMSKG